MLYRLRICSRIDSLTKNPLIGSDVFLFDEKGNEIEVNFYDANGILYTKTISKYDTKGNRIEFYHYNSNDKSEVSLDAKVYRKFDDNGNEIEFQKYNASIDLQDQDLLLELMSNHIDQKQQLILDLL